MTVGVIISTYNNPDYLRLALLGYCRQSHPADEIIIADDGSRKETREMIDTFRDRLPIKHIWQEDEGFQKSRILNKAIVASTADYLIFTDQDCIPREDFVATHVKHAQRGCFLSGGYFKMAMSVTQQVDEESILSGDVFRISWLRCHGQKLSFKMSKLFRSSWYAWLLNHITPASASWNGCNASGWRADALAINGYNEDMHYGGQDREFGERLWNYGCISKQIRYSAIVMHLDHKRPYRTKESIAVNRAIRKKTKREHIVRTANGIEK